MGPRLLLLTIAAAALLSGLPGCGGSSSGYLKVDSPLIPFEPPEEDELLEALDVDPEEDGAATEEATPDPASSKPAAKP